MPHVDWGLEAIDVTTCNCDFSCPCQFNALPTHGDCRAAVGFLVEKGHFGDTTLDGVKFVVLAAWPRAIHEGNGQAQLILDEATTEDQRKAVFALVKGDETEPGATSSTCSATSSTSTMARSRPPSKSRATSMPARRASRCLASWRPPASRSESGHRRVS